MKILMIEDNLDLAETLIEYLFKFDMQVTNVESPYLGLSKLAQNDYDLIILDLTLPDIDGFETCKEIRKKSDIPIIISSVRNDVSDKVMALELGADDYLPKPYDPKELKARIKTIIKRYRFKSQDLGKSKDDFELFEDSMQIKFNGKLLDLTRAEYGILRFFIKHKNCVISRSELILNIDCINEDSSNKSIDVIVGRIRNKLGDNPKKPKYIHSIRGVGYKFLQ